MKAFLALDYGTTTGWSRLDLPPDGGAVWAHGSWDCTGKPLARLTALKERLTPHLTLGVNTLVLVGRALAVRVPLSKLCAERGVAFETPDFDQVRKFVAGSILSTNSDLAAAMRARGFEPITERAARAVAALLYAQEQGA